MALNAAEVKGTASKRVEQPLLEVCAHPGRLVQVIDLGVQARKPYKGTPKDPIQMIHATYELSEDFMIDEDGNEQEDKPRWLSERFPLHNLKADRATSTKRYLALDPRKEHGGDFAACVGNACSVTVVHNDKDGITYNNVGDVTPAPKMRGYVQPELKNDPVVFDLSDPDIEVFQALPEFLQEMIKRNLNYQGSLLQQRLGGAPAAGDEPEPNDPEGSEDEGNDDDIPF